MSSTDWISEEQTDMLRLEWKSTGLDKSDRRACNRREMALAAKFGMTCNYTEKDLYSTSEDEFSN